LVEKTIQEMDVPNIRSVLQLLAVLASGAFAANPLPFRNSDRKVLDWRHLLWFVVLIVGSSWERVIQDFVLF